MMAVETKTNEPREGQGKPAPLRTCVGCANRVPANELVRVIVDESSPSPICTPTESTSGAVLAVDLADSRFGRGAHVHPSLDCLGKALKSGFARAFKTRVKTSVAEMAAQIVASADRRIVGLVAGARRARHAVSGADVVCAALRDGRAALVVVARDGAAATTLPEIQRAIAQGMAIAWSNKKDLGALFGRDEVAVCAVLHKGVAAAIASAHRTSQPFMDGARSEPWWSPEVR